MKEHKIRTKKSLVLSHEARAKWGQNFLKDPKILKKIADFAQVKNTDIVVEVGPGEGTLTKILLERAARVVAIEKDEKLAESLKLMFKLEIENSKLKIITGDILEIEKLSKGIFKMPRSQKMPFDSFEDYVLVGNIPYYITGALFKKFLESENQPKSITFVVQKEVAERILARDGKESMLSISIKAYGTSEFGGVIKAGSFSPKPKVDSAIIAVRNISREKFSFAEQERSSSKRKSPWFSSFHSARLFSEGFLARQKLEQRFFEILKLGFAHKRKLLIKNLLALSEPNVTGMSRFNLDINQQKLRLKEIFEKCGISEKIRAEDLKVEDWLCLTKELM